MAPRTRAEYADGADEAAFDFITVCFINPYPRLDTMWRSYNAY
jgi:hypothetical protein